MAWNNMNLTLQLQAVNPNVGAAVKMANVNNNEPTSTFHLRLTDGILVRVDWLQVPTAGEITQAETIIFAYDPSDVLEAAYLRAQAAELLDKAEDLFRIIRAVVLVTRNENNLIRQRLVDQDAVIAAFTGGTAAAAIADLKSRWSTAASNNPMPQRSISDAKTAIKNKVKDTESD